MASSAVSYALAKLDLIADKVKLLCNVSNQVKLMQSELTTIEGFLKDANSKGRRDPAVRQWVNRVRDVAHRTEDAIDIFLIDTEGNHTSSSWRCSKVEKLVKSPIKLSELHKELKETVETLRTISQQRINLGITNTRSVSEDNQQHLRTTNHFEIDDSEIVGRHSDKSQIIKRLLDSAISRLTVVSIVGIGGLGKTTLAQKIFRSTEVVKHFDYLIWLPISQKFNESDLLRKILHSIRPNVRLDEPAAADENLEQEVQISLSRKRYFIVLDDVWTPFLWQHLRGVLPDDNNASRVLITSRNTNVVADSEPHKLCYLNAEESLALLFKIAFRKRELGQYVSQYSDSHFRPSNDRYLVKYVKRMFGWFRGLTYGIPDQQAYNYTYSDQCYPANLIEVAKQLAEKCGGLPLALIVLGGILSTKEPNFGTWKLVKETLDRHNTHVEQCSQVVITSYEDLPSHLKSCFLYFALFPEDYEISAKHVTRMWIAEGFIPRDGAGAGTIENKAEELLEDLVQRCLVQVTKKTWNGYAKHCRIHDLLREIAIREAKEDNFFTNLSEEENLSQLVPAGSVMRRATLQLSNPTDFEVHSKSTHSLFCFWECISKFRGFRLLRVLVIERVCMSGKQASYKSWLESLVHLKYLGFRYCKKMPKGFENISFSTLKNLETLDCKKTKIRPFNTNHSLWKVPTLRHVIISIPSGVHCPLKWTSLKNLQTLKWVSLVNIPTLQCDLSLCTLKIQNLRQYGSVEEGWRRLEALLLRTPHLISLTVRIINGCIPFLTAGTRNLPCHTKIQSLWLRGDWTADLCVLCVEMFPTNLTKLRLECSCFHEDPMPILEKLQSLRILQLWGNSYLGIQLTCSTGGFPGLQKLELVDLYYLRQWEIQEGAMSVLSHLTIDKCPELHALPDLQLVPTLQQLLVTNASPVLQQRSWEEDLYKIKQISSVHIAVDSNIGTD